eukprot:357884-Chlamydomonas_euryale.AAC.3
MVCMLWVDWDGVHAVGGWAWRGGEWVSLLARLWHGRTPVGMEELPLAWGNSRRHGELLSAWRDPRQHKGTLVGMEGPPLAWRDSDRHGGTPVSTEGLPSAWSGARWHGATPVGMEGP